MVDQLIRRLDDQAGRRLDNQKKRIRIKQVLEESIFTVRTLLRYCVS